MATKKPTNQELLNAIRNDASAEYKEKVPVAKSHEDIMTIASVYDDYPSIKNEFIEKLTAKIFRSVVMNRVWNNPLQVLKKGEVPYGMGIEQLFIDLADKKNFWDNFTLGSQTGAYGDGYKEDDNLLKQQKSNVAAKFITENFQYKYKVSLSNQRLRNAFQSATGIADFIDGQIASVMSAANFNEFDDMLKILTRSSEVKYESGNWPNKSGGPNHLGKIEKGLIYRIADFHGQSSRKDDFGRTLSGAKPLKMYQTVKFETGKDEETSAKIRASVKDLAKKIKTYASEMSFLSTDYNLTGAKTFTNPEDLVLFIGSDYLADLDVDLLAGAFNVSRAEVPVRIIRVPMTAFETITGSSNRYFGGTVDLNNKHITPIAILADKELVQQYDTLIESGSFYNPENLMTNMFVHRHGITAMCDFAQAVVFCTQATGA